MADFKDRHSDYVGAEFEGHWRYPCRRFRVIAEDGETATVESVYGPKRRRTIALKRLQSSRYVLKHLGPGDDGFIRPWPGSRSSGCLNCPPKPDSLPLHCNPHPGFGAVLLYRDREAVDCVVTDDEAAGYEVKHHEVLAAADPDHDWRIKVDGPMSDATYQRQGDGRWVLIEKGMGFA